MSQSIKNTESETMPESIKFDFAVDEMMDYCENECTRETCKFGYNMCPHIEYEA